MSAHDGWRDLAELNAPVRLRWVVATTSGHHAMSLCFDRRGFEAGQADAAKVAEGLWGRVFAPRIGRDAELFVAQAETLGGFQAAPPRVPSDGRGLLQEPIAPLSSSPALVLMSGDRDPGGRRRFYIPGTPRRWQRDGWLTNEGESQLTTLARGLATGTFSMGLYSDWRLILYRPGHPFAGPDGPRPAAWRPVVHVRVCGMTAKAPESL